MKKFSVNCDLFIVLASLVDLVSLNNVTYAIFYDDNKNIVASFKDPNVITSFEVE